ncbi:DegV family protein [Clostridium sp. AL.422]|uniref:DegV family protein n=1 Tax=Clostridium TaxID=1485 RepID=UPI00293DE836|nr:MULTISPECIES: DegV family protein [unclassified Clostridium]MDV4151855.1 DegV family protein [Clostridium sp. AL.422]
MNIKLITDSACDLSIDYIRENDIDFASLMVNLNGEFIKDDLGQTLNHEYFYKALKEGAMPTTTQINVGTFHEIFTKHVEQGKTVLYIGVSSALSGTISSAVTARNMVLEEHPDAKIYIVDSLCASVGEGVLIYKAVEMIKNNSSIEDIVDYLESIKRKVIHLITVDDLNHLKRGGRIPGAVAMVGGLLGIKPTLKIDSEGNVVATEKIKGRKKALRSLVEQMKVKGENIEEQNIFICHADCLEDALEVKKMILKEFNVKDVIISSIGAAIGTHGGPGTLGLIFIGDER